METHQADHDWFFLKSLTANCSCPNAARPILKTAQEIASTMGVKTAIIRQSIAFQNLIWIDYIPKTKQVKPFLHLDASNGRRESKLIKSKMK